jgi:hypothetical protein
MTLDQFLGTYGFRTSEHNVGNINYVIITEVFRRADNTIVDGIKTTLDINETNDWIRDSHSAISLNQLDGKTIIDSAIRAQLDFFAQRVPITDFFPMNKETDISNLG